MKRKLSGALRSWTIWFNSIAASALPALDYAQQNLPVIREILPEHWYGLLVAAIIAGNFVLRFKTNCDLGDK
jgi:hypothetical protein